MVVTKNILFYEQNIVSWNLMSVHNLCKYVEPAPLLSHHDKRVHFMPLIFTSHFEYIATPDSVFSLAEPARKTIKRKLQGVIKCFTQVTSYKTFV